MAEVGEIKKARELGHKGSSVYCYTPCPECGVARWVRKIDVHRICPPCGRKAMGEKRKYTGRESIRASALGLTSKKDYWLYRDSCPRCGRLVWRRQDYFGRMCFVCGREDRKHRLSQMRGEQHPRWAGGRRISKNGYVLVVVQPDDPYYSMVSKGNHEVLEHRLVMAKHLGRCLESWEVVHHRNEKEKTNNAIENLELLPGNTVNISYSRLQKRIEKQELQIKLLQWRVRELEKEHSATNYEEA